MDRTILFNASSSEKRVALLENGKLTELVVERPDDQRLVGNIYRGKVESILPGLQAAFVDIGLGRAGFLHVSDVDPSLLLDLHDARQDKQRGLHTPLRLPIEKVLQKGQQILVQVLKEPIGTKGPKVTTQLSLAGRFLVLVPDTDFIGVSKKTQDTKMRRRVKQIVAELKPQGIGFIVRTIGLSVTEDDYISEIRNLIDTWRNIQNRALEGSGPAVLHQELGTTTKVVRDLLSDQVSEVVVDSKADYDEVTSYLSATSPHLCERVRLYADKLPLFDKYNIEKDLEQSLRRKVWLRSGGYVLFDHAEALLAIDVNTGRNVGKRDHEQTLLETNLEAGSEIGRQLRLRDIGGIIVIDFIDLDRAESRRKLENHMRDVFKTDPAPISTTPLSKFGLMEITRKRVRPELQELYTDECHVCGGLGWIFSPATVATSIDRWLQRASAQGLPQSLTLAVHPAVHAYLTKEKRELLNRMEEQLKVKLSVVEDESQDQDEFEVFAEGSSEPLSIKN